jgi:hypothetical protein
MILLRAHPYRLLASGLLPLCMLSLALVFAYGPARVAGSGQPKPAGSDARLRELLTQRFELLQATVKDFELWLAAGRVDLPTHQKLLDALYRAQADLGTTIGARVQVYEKLVEVLTTQEKLAERQGDAGRLPGIEVAQVKLVTLNAQIDLERLRLGQPASQ